MTDTPDRRDRPRTNRETLDLVNALIDQLEVTATQLRHVVSDAWERRAEEGTQHDDDTGT